MFVAALIMSCSTVVHPAEAARLLGTEACDVQQVELHHIDGRTSDLSITLSGHRVQFKCHQHANRSADYQVLEDMGGGQMRQHEQQQAGQVHEQAGRSTSRKPAQQTEGRQA